MKLVQGILLDTDPTKDAGLSAVHKPVWQFGQDMFHYTASTKGLFTNINKTSEQPSFISCTKKK